jgi:hypothetical protein
MGTPVGFADCSYKLTRSDMSRSSYVTFGVQTTMTDPMSIAAVLVTAFTSTGGFAAFLDSGASLTETRVALGTGTGEDVVGIDPTISAGQKGGVTSPPNVAMLVHKRTARGGRRGRGRMFVPWSWTTAEVQENGVVLATPLTTANVAVNAWLTKINTGLGAMVILHGPGKSTLGAPNTVTSLSVDNIIGTQRRRLGR